MSKKIFLLLTILAGVIIFTPQLNFQHHLAQGDHGRDLYSFKKTSEGAIPYKDYWSQNGPLMPYYYASWYKVFDVSIQSTLKGFYFLIFLTGIFIYLTCASFLPPLYSFTCALWYWAFRGNEFFYTYNHIGAVCLIVLSIYLAFQYIKTQNRRHILFAILSLFSICLIRPNIGLASIVAFFTSISLTDFIKNSSNKKKLLIQNTLIALSILGISFLIYWFLSSQIPTATEASEATKELAYWKHAKLMILPKAFVSLIKFYIFKGIANIPQIILSLLFMIMCIRTALFFKKRTTNNPEQQNLFLALITLFIFYAFNIAEFLFCNLWFRQHWVISIQYMIFFFILCIGLKNTKKSISYFLIIPLMVILSFPLYNNARFVKSNKTSYNRLKQGSTDIYLPLSQHAWIQTVQQTTNFIKKNIPKNEKIIAIPYAPVYYFLSDRDSATWDLTFIKKYSREDSVLEKIKKDKTPYILLSNRALRPIEMRFGVFGKDYGKQITEYLTNNYKEVVTYGPWELPAGWTANHAIKILQRKND